MSNKRITDLTELTTPTTDDVFPVVDIATNTTTKVQLGNLPVPTSVTTALATKQDTLVSGTNIKTLNSTSLLGSGNIVLTANPSGVAGAIQFSDGSAFASDATNFFWNNTTKRLGIRTNSPTATTHIVGVDQLSTSTSLLVQDSVGANILRVHNSAVNSAVEMSSAKIGTYDIVSSNVLSNTQMRFVPITGGLAINRDYSNAAANTFVHIKGSGSTSATTSLLVQNSTGSTAIEIKDNLKVGMGAAFADGSSGFGTTVASITANYPCFLMNQTAGATSKVGFNLETAKLYFSEETNGSTLFGHRIMADTRVGGLVVLNNTAAGSIASLNASAVLQADSTTRGFLPPRMTTTQKNAIATPTSGLVVYDSTTNKLCCYNGSTWNDLF